MSLADKNPDDSQLKQPYMEKIRKYLPQNWNEDKINEFIEAIFKGITIPIIPERYNRSDFEIFVKGISQSHPKWIFSSFLVRDENNRIKGRRYFPNTAIITRKKVKAEKHIEYLQQEYQNL